MSATASPKLEVECSDDENYGFTFDESCNEWLPSTEVITQLYTSLSKGDPMTLEWTCPGRRKPDVEVKQEQVLEQDMKEPKIQDRLETTEFDFDEMTPEDENPSNMTPRRTPGRRGPSTKRVASLDKIMNDLFRHRKLQSSPRTSPRGSPRTPRGSPGFHTPSQKSPTPGSSMYGGQKSPTPGAMMYGGQKSPTPGAMMYGGQKSPTPGSMLYAPPQKSPGSSGRSPAGTGRSPAGAQRSPAGTQRSPASAQRSPASAQRSPGADTVPAASQDGVGQDRVVTSTVGAQGANQMS